MIIGYIMIARFLIKFERNFSDYMLFASGAYNSRHLEFTKFEREFSLLNSILKFKKEFNL